MSEKKGHRKLRLCSKKNYEKKRTEARRRALLTKSCDRELPDTSSQFLESSKKSQVEENIVSLHVSIPLSYFTDYPVQSLEVLHRRLHMVDTISEGMLCFAFLYVYIIYLFIEWIYVYEDTKISICKLSSADKGLAVTLSLTIQEDFSWDLTYKGDTVDPKACRYLHGLPLLTNSGMHFCA